MSRLSRDEQFRFAVDKYMVKWEHNNRISYSLKNNTNNKTCSRHIYKLTILELYDLELNPITTGLPTVSEFMRNMENYFSPYYNYASYITITTNPTDEPISILNFIVVYYKDQLPFPNPKSRMKEYENKIENYKEEVEELETIIDYERLAKKKLKIRLNLISVNIQKNVQKMYENNNILEDCPVCLDPIAVNNIIVPICFHNICNTCYKRCKICPICRDKYVKIQIQIPSHPIS